MEKGQGNEANLCGDFEEAMTNPPARPDGRSVPKMTPQVRAACDFMIFEAMSWDAAAVKAGVPARSMRRALHRPYVLKYLRDERQVLLAAISTATPLRLAQLRDQDENRNAAVNAARTLEGLDTDTPHRGGHASAPGFVIVFNSPLSALPAGEPVIAIEASPVEDSPLGQGESPMRPIGSRVVR
jgi:hypothetical protein